MGKTPPKKPMVKKKKGSISKDLNPNDLVTNPKVNLLTLMT